MTTFCPKCGENPGVLRRQHSGCRTYLVCSRDKKHKFVAGYESLAFQRRRTLKEE